MRENELKILEGILEGKEKRVEKQKALVNRYNNSLISFTLNIPGLYKLSDKYQQLHLKGQSLIENKLKNSQLNILKKETSLSPAGYEAFYVIEGDAKVIKTLAVYIEDEYSFGRIFDIDVFDKNLNQLSRSDLGLEKRKCLVCDKKAVICARTKAHSLEMILASIEKLI
ncbi:MAG: citrate lyase holo-[acyl-carrier protein] synthase [Sarcina sp.]